MELLIHICALPKRRTQIYSIINNFLPRLSYCLKTLPLHYLYVKEYFDEAMFFPLMKDILKELFLLIPDQLAFDFPFHFTIR